MLIGDVLRRQAAPSGRPEKPALVCEDGAVSFGELNRRANRIANALIGLGVKPGDRVGLLGRNSPDWVAAYYGAAKCGAVLVPVNFWYRAGEVAYVLNDSGARVCVLDRAHVPADEAEMIERWVWLDEAAVGAEDEPDVSGLHESDAHIILYTSGTTGFPKGAVMSHRAHVLHALTFALHTGAHAGDVYLNVYPLFHTGGTDCAVLPYHLVGATVGLVRDPKPEAVLDALERLGVTAMMAVPTIWRRLVDLPDMGQRDLSRFRRAMGSSDAMPRDLLEEVMARFGATWTQTYGLTEAGCILTYLPPDDHTRKIGSAGKPHAQADLWIADPARAQETDWPLRPEHRLGPGEVGEVVARTEHAMTEYWGKPEQTAAAVRNGCLRTGDLGYLDEEGYLFIAGRLKDVIVSGGEKIYPAEVEPQLRGYPGVRELALVGVPDREWGESVLAAVVTEDGDPLDADAFRRWARARVAGYKVPKHVVVVSELPRTTGTGKVQKAALRDRFASIGAS
ncbi:MAG TPA: AMP-binding protein [Chloroflexota bacterium]|nr:AMP-binding protein [Chloroflexota bacterium]